MWQKLIKLLTDSMQQCADEIEAELKNGAGLSHKQFIELMEASVPDSDKSARLFSTKY